MRLLLVLVTFVSVGAHAQSSLDRTLKGYIAQFKMKPLDRVKSDRPKLFELGEKLFKENKLSGNKNISCLTCHDPATSTADALPVSIGEGAKIVGKKRYVTNETQIGPRNTPALFNVGNSGLEHFFWDGRVSYHSGWNEYTTPEEGLNGDYPEYWEITEQLDGGLSAQILFPMVTEQEMMGQKGSNEIASANSNFEAWALLTKRITSDDNYKSLIKENFGEENVNIGHLASAIAHYIKIEFSRTETSWDRYLRGDLNAMSESEKQGAIVFMGSGRCVTCHSGSLLGGRVFAGLATPQVGPGKDIKHNDEGRFYTSKRDAHRYSFRAPLLRNVALTAPYFHSGVYQTLEEVVEHYRSGLAAIDNYDPKFVYSFEGIYGGKLFLETNHYMIFRKKNHAHKVIKEKQIQISDLEKANLIQFLKKSLTQE